MKYSYHFNAKCGCEKLDGIIGANKPVKTQEDYEGIKLKIHERHPAWCVPEAISLKSLTLLWEEKDDGCYNCSGCKDHNLVLDNKAVSKTLDYIEKTIQQAHGVDDDLL